jgi:hypothetical protein
MLEHEVGSNPFVDNPALALRVDLTPRRDGVAGSVELSESGEVKGHRELSSGECAALVAALALVIGVELDPFALSRRRAPDVEVQSTAPVERRGGPDLFLSTGGLAVFGTAPTVAGAVAVGFSARWGDWFQAGLEGQATLPASYYNVSQLLAIGSFCARHWSLGLCGLLAAGSNAASYAGGSSSGGYFAPGVRLEGEIALSPSLSLIPRADLYFVALEPLRVTPLPAPPGEINPPPYQAPAVNGSVGLAFQARIL